jgi:hypothetical protein
VYEQQDEGLQEIETIGGARLKGGVPLALSDVRGRTMTCIVITPPGSSLTATLDSARVLSFSRIFPAFINFMSFVVFGPFSLPAKNIRMQKNWSIGFVNVCTQTTIPPYSCTVPLPKEEKPAA